MTIGTIGKYIAKGVGITAIGLVAKDAHSVGKIYGDKYATEKDAYYCSDYLNNTLYNPTMSDITDSVKDSALNMEIDQTWRRFFNLGLGYAKGFATMITNEVIPFGLGLGALFTKGPVAKACAGGALLYGAAKFIKNFFGLGVPKGPLDYKDLMYY